MNSRVLTNEMYRASYHAAWLSALFLPTVQIISAVALGFIVWYGGLQANVGIMTIGGISSICQLPDLYDVAYPRPGACVC